MQGGVHYDLPYYMSEQGEIQSLIINHVRKCNCSGQTHLKEIEIKVPESVTCICDQFFSDCTSVIRVTFVNGARLRRICSEAFKMCENLQCIEIPESVEEIGNRKSVLLWLLFTSLPRFWQ